MTVIVTTRVTTMTTTLTTRVTTMTTTLTTVTRRVTHLSDEPLLHAVLEVDDDDDCDGGVAE